MNLLEEKIKECLKNIFDPEIPINIYDLGLIYNIEADTNGKINLTMTLTSPNCPMVDQMVQEIHDKITAISGVSELHINIVFDPPWSKDSMSDEALLSLGLL